MSPELTHIDEHGRASMVDVSRKALTFRQAWARCRVVGVGELVDPETPTGRAVLEAARVAGITGAKETSALVPLCHTLPLTGIELQFERDGADLLVSSRTETVAQTGVEMEALAACATAALTLLAAVIAEAPAARVEALTLWEKHGGKSGIWRREDATPTERPSPA